MPVGSAQAPSSLLAVCSGLEGSGFVCIWCSLQHQNAVQSCGCVWTVGCLDSGPLRGQARLSQAQACRVHWDPGQQHPLPLRELEWEAPRQDTRLLGFMEDGMFGDPTDAVLSNSCFQGCRVLGLPRSLLGPNHTYSEHFSIFIGTVGQRIYGCLSLWDHSKYIWRGHGNIQTSKNRSGEVTPSPLT